MSEQEINELVEMYNAVEDDQYERLTRLYDLMDARKGGSRRVEFGKNESWGPNSFGRGVRRDLAQRDFVDSKIRKIIMIDIGEPA